jgi:hypothetical protein
MLTMQEIEMLAGLLQRAGVNVYEMVWANSILDRLRTIALEQQAKAMQEQKKDDQTATDIQP